MFFFEKKNQKTFMSLRLCLGLAIAGMVLGGACLARAETPGPLDAFKALEGNWTISANGKPLAIQMSYATGSKGHAVTEQFGKELSVFWTDGPALMLTHYCNFGNVPVLRLAPGTAGDTREFDLVRVDNLRAANEDHVEKMIYRFRSARAISLDIIWYHPAGKGTEHYDLTRP
jgi:hypothetical protein